MSAAAERSAGLHRKERALHRRRLKRGLEGLLYRGLALLIHPKARTPPVAPRRVLLLLRRQRRGDAVVSLAFSAAVTEQFPQAEVWAAGPPAVVATLRCDKNLRGVLPLPEREWRHPWRARQAWRQIRSMRFDLAFVLGIHFWSTVLGRLVSSCAIGYDYNHRGFALDRRLVPHVFCNRSGWEYGADTHPPHITDFWGELLASVSGKTPAVSWRGLDLAPYRPSARGFVTRSIPGRTPLIAFHPYAQSANRTWPAPFARAFLESVLRETDWRVVLTGAERDRDAASRLTGGLGARVAVAAGTLALGETWALLAEAALLVSVDTALVHMAAAAGTPVVALHGPSDPLVWGPHGQAEGVLQANEWCQRCKRSRCLHRGVPCMEALTPEMVFHAARRRIARIGG